MNKTIEKSVSILELISLNEDGLTLQEITEHMKMPKSSTYDIMQSLKRAEMVEISNNKKYLLGFKAFNIGVRYRIDINKYATLYLPPIAEKYNKSAFVGIYDDGKVLYTYKYQSSKARLVTCKIGTRNDLYCTSLGKILLAYMNEEEAIKILSNIDLKRKTDKTIVNIEDLVDELRKIKKNGYSLDLFESETYMKCFGAPIFDYNGRCIAAISLSDIFLPNDIESAVVNDIKETALKISRKIGYKF